MKICYFGIYNPDFGRNKVYLAGLRQLGHQIIECRDMSPGPIKFFKLWQKHRAFKDDYDFMIVGYPGQLATPLAKLISRKKVVVDALGSLYDAEVHSHRPSLIRKFKSWLLDWLMVQLADKILLESEAQKAYFISRFGLKSKYEVIYTSAYLKTQLGNREHKTKSCFDVLFRGKLTPESGILHILQAAKMLESNQHIRFKIVGSGYLLNEVHTFIDQEKSTNVNLITQFLSDEELVGHIKSADLMLGQFTTNSRLNRTIPHKAFEALAFGVPYITGNTPAIKELFQDGINGFLIPLASQQVLADKIRFLAKEPDLLTVVGVAARQTFNEKCTPEILAGKIIKAVL